LSFRASPPPGIRSIRRSLSPPRSTEPRPSNSAGHATQRIGQLEARILALGRANTRLCHDLRHERRQASQLRHEADKWKDALRRHAPDIVDTMLQDDAFHSQAHPSIAARIGQVVYEEAMEQNVEEEHRKVEARDTDIVAVKLTVSPEGKVTCAILL
jgi:hypothetical protein